MPTDNYYPSQGMCGLYLEKPVDTEVSIVWSYDTNYDQMQFSVYHPTEDNTDTFWLCVRCADLYPTSPTIPETLGCFLCWKEDCVNARIMDGWQHQPGHDDYIVHDAKVLGRTDILRWLEMVPDFEEEY